MRTIEIRFVQMETFLARVNVADDWSAEDLHEVAERLTTSIEWSDVVEEQGDVSVAVDSIKDVAYETDVWLNDDGEVCFFDPYEDMVEL